MTPRLPALFVSHGAPTLVMDDCPTRTFLQQLGTAFDRPRAILCVSAHWTTAAPQLTMHPKPATIHDFGGFPDELYRLAYPAPGDPMLAKQARTLLAGEGIASTADMGRGLDHGAWVPLMLMYPEATIPVVQLSVQPALGAVHHLALGRALQPLRDEGVLILASGGATHNLLDLFGHGPEAPPPAYVREFADWLMAAVIAGRTDEIADYLVRAPHARQNHPTPEHFLPLLVAMGAGGPGRLLHDAYTFGILSMAAFAWD